MDYRDLFLAPCIRTDEKGIAELSWRDDPLNSQIILDEITYRKSFPDNRLPWPHLGEITVPENVKNSVVCGCSVKTDGNIICLSSYLHNTEECDITLDYVRIALPMDQCFREDDVFKYEQNVIRHTGLIGNCAYAYWQKPGGKPPVYLMLACGETFIDRFYVDSRYTGASFEGLYFLEMTDQPIILKTGAELRYEFRIAIIEKETYLSDALPELGGLGTDIIPGMAVPRGERILVKLKTKRCIERVYFSDECSEVKDLGNGIYESFGAGSGEKKMVVSYSDGGFSRLRFFVTDRPTDIIDDYASHVAKKQFETDPDDPCYHGILAWNMTDRCRVDSKNNPFVNWMAGGSDEIGLVSGLFLSEKNCIRPREDEIRVLGMHVRDFIEDRLTEQPGNRVHRMVPWYKMFEPWAGHGADDVWRAYNYVHVANICYNMYRIQKEGRYPFLDSPLHYLRKAYDYSAAMFSYWMYPEGKGALEYGNMGELNIALHLVGSLEKEGMKEEAEKLGSLIKAKADTLSGKKYPFGSEMVFDTTAYEAVYAYAKLNGDEKLQDRAVSSSLANRALTPVWHKYGIDVRSEGDSYWNVSYMTQLGIWPVVDMLLEGRLTDPEAAVMSHAATLGGFCMYNSGGVWDDAPVNRHATWWVMNERLEQGNSPECFKPRKKISGEAGLGYFGSLYASCAFRLVHRDFGETLLGCHRIPGALHETIFPDPFFSMRYCDLINGFALVCEHCTIDLIEFYSDHITVQVSGMKRHTSDMTIRIRSRETGRWTQFKAHQESPVRFDIDI